MRNFSPRSALQNDALVQREQPKKRPFGSGVWNDVPASEVPENGIAYASGYIPREYGAEAAGGCVQYSAAVLPSLPGRTGYSLSKSGARVIKTVGTAFSASDVGNVIIHDDGVNERIVAYVDANTVDVENTDPHEPSTAAYLRGPVNATYYHRSTGKVLLHIDTRLFYSDTLITSYTEIFGISYRRLANAKSVILEERDYAVIISSTGIFKVNLADIIPLYYKINSPNPEYLLTDTAKTALKIYGNKYLFSMSRITGDDDTRNRMSDGAVIEHETGTGQYNNQGLDYAAIFHDRPLGDASTTYGVITGDALTAPYDVSTGWSVITNGQWRISIDGVSYNFAADFSDCKTMSDVAARIQSAMRAEHSTIICEYATDHFVITNPKEAGTVSNTSVGDGGTDIGATIMACEGGTGISTNPDYSQNLTVGTLLCPVDPTDTTIPQFHHTHYSVYRTLDIGENSIDPITGVGNNEEQFIWLMDVPIAKAFVAGVAGGEAIAVQGLFQEIDVGSKLIFQSNLQVILKKYVSPTRMEVTSGYATIATQAAAIGGDIDLSMGIRILTCSQAGTTVTRTAGVSFSATDVGKTIFFAGGLRAHIVAYTDPNTVTVAETQTITSTGACLDPKARNFNDTLSDDDLRPRITNFSLRHRFWEPLPESSRGVFVPGFFFVWANYAKTMYYGHIPSSKEYLIGSHNPDQYTTFKDKILIGSEFPDTLVVYCANSTSGIPTNTFLTMNVNDVLQYYKISGQYILDHERGLLNISWMRKLPNGDDWLITNEPAVRICNGRAFSENLADKRYMKVIESLKADGSLLYDRWHGITIFGED